MKKDLISIADLSTQEIEDIFKLSRALKSKPARFNKALAGKTLALVFQKPSNRTRVSFSVGMYQLGGNSIYLAPNEISLGVRESIPDVAKTLARYIDAIVLRTFEHKNVVEMAKYCSKPVINGLSDFSHPCQGLADLYTVNEKLKKIKGKTLAYVGDGNNVAHSLLFACAKAGMNINVGTPKGFEPDIKVVRQAKECAKKTGSVINIFDSAARAAEAADVIYTDVWTSMGQEAEAEERKRIFREFQVNAALVKHANKGALIMHCLPAHRGEEITAEVIDGNNSVVFDQAENRMHVQKAILMRLLG